MAGIRRAGFAACAALKVDTMTIELLQQALDVLEHDVMQATYAGGVKIANVAIAIRAELAKTAQQRKTTDYLPITADERAWLSDNPNTDDLIQWAHDYFDKDRAQRAAQQERKRPINCGTGHCSCIECLFPDVAQQERKPDAYIRKDQLEKAKVSAMLCEVTHEPRADRIAIYTSPVAQQERKPDACEHRNYGWNPWTHTGKCRDCDAELICGPNGIEATPPAQQERKPEQCEWKPEDQEFTPYTYASTCGELWSFIDGGPIENRVKFCQGCGKPVILKEYP